MQKDGKIVITGTLYIQYPNRYHFIIFRCTKEGAVDSTFGDKGFIQPSDEFLTNTLLFDIKVQPDGKIVTAGRIDQLVSDNTGTSMLILRFMENGKQDKTFGKNGNKIVSIGTFAIATALQILPKGKILLGGNSYPPGKNNQNITVVRLTAAGGLDTSFGKSGSIVTTIEDQSFTRDLLPTSTRQFVIGGVAIRGRDGDFVLVRYQANGNIDSSFGTYGITTTDFGMYDNITQLALQPDGKIVAFGITETINSKPGKYRVKFALSRYKKNGKIDIYFGNNGRVITDFGNAISQAYTGFI